MSSGSGMNAGEKACADHGKRQRNTKTKNMLNVKRRCLESQLGRLPYYALTRHVSLHESMPRMNTTAGNGPREFDHTGLLRYALPHGLWNCVPCAQDGGGDGVFTANEFLSTLHHILSKKASSTGTTDSSFFGIKKVSPDELVLGPRPLLTNNFYAYVVEVIFERKYRGGGNAKNWDGIIYIHAPRSKVSSDFDHQFHGIIIVSVLTSTFFSTHMKNATGRMTPLPVKWLRLVSRKKPTDKLVAANGFVREILAVSRIRVGNLQTKPSLIMSGYQLHDNDSKAPLLVPDILPGSGELHTLNEKRSFYRECLHNSPSNRSGCRKYVKGSRHSLLPNDVLILDQREQGDMDLAITVWGKKMFVKKGSKSGKSQQGCHIAYDVDDDKLIDDRTWIRIRSATKHTVMLENINKVASRLPRSGWCRPRAGDDGSMFAIGDKFNTSIDTDEYELGKSNPVVMQYNPLACRMAYEFGSKMFGEVVNDIKSCDYASNRIPPTVMGGFMGLGCSMSISRDLGNATHMDVNDGSYGMSIWTEFKPGQGSNWYFVLPNVILSFRNRTYQGVAIRLFHGCSISWDGRLVRHGTATPSGVGVRVGNHVMGTFWSTSTKLHEMALKNYEKNHKAA